MDILWLMVKGTKVTELEALEQAEKIVRSLEDPPKNERGYGRDGWKAPTFAERIQAIITLAEFILGVTNDSQD
jgi:2-keto-3-deoxy-L-rhamnonate aldolase RhmA